MEETNKCEETKDLEAKIDLFSETISTFMKLNSDIFKIAWLNEGYDGQFGAKAYKDIRDIRHEYPGQTWLYFPIYVLLPCDEPLPMLCDECKACAADGYVLVSKRIYKTMHPWLKHAKSEELKKEVKYAVGIFIDNLRELQSKKTKRKIGGHS